jgi:hypothetical protein
VTFENISMSLRRPSGGGVAPGEEGARPWSPRCGRTAGQWREIRRSACRQGFDGQTPRWKLRVKDLTYNADLPPRRVKGAGRDAMPTYFRGGSPGGRPHIDTDTPDYPMPIDRRK